MAVTLSDDEVFCHKSKSDQEGNLMAFTATIEVSEPEIIEWNPSNGELSENSNLQKAYNKFCKIATKDVIIDTVFCSPLIYIPNLEKSKNIIFSPWGCENIQNDIA